MYVRGLMVLMIYDTHNFNINYSSNLEFSISGLIYYVDGSEDTIKISSSAISSSLQRLVGKLSVSVL